MKKGFTLIELLGVIVILGVLSVIIVPVVNNMMLESRENLAEAQEKSILKAAKNWGHDHIFMLPDCEGAANCDDTITITLGQIMNDGFLDNQLIKDVNKNKIYSEATEIVIGKNNNQNTYKMGSNPYADEIEMPEGGPSIVLTGSSTVTEEANRDGSSSFIEPGVTVQNANGQNIAYTVQVIRTSLKGVSQNTTLSTSSKTAGASGYSLGFNTKTVANYKIVYTATASGKTAKMVRNVQVKDTTAPTISFVSNIEVDKGYASQYNTQSTLSSNVVVIDPSLSSDVANTQRSNYLKQISKVVVMDNSCTASEITVKIESAVKNQVGTYSIKYTATDKYKNKYSKTRMVKIIDG